MASDSGERPRGGCAAAGDCSIVAAPEAEVERLRENHEDLIGAAGGEGVDVAVVVVLWLGWTSSWSISQNFWISRSADTGSRLDCGAGAGAVGEASAALEASGAELQNQPMM